MSERSHHHNPAAHSRSRPTREKGAVPFQLIGHHQLRTPRFHSPPCLGNGGSWIAGSRRLPLFPRKEGQARAELPHREPLTMHANRPLKDIACVLHAQTKDATVVCVIGCQITRTRIHTLPKRLASARHSRVRKLYSYQIHSARFKQTSQWRRKSWWCILPAALILWYAGSDVMGCRRPTGGVFSYVSSDRVTLRAFPVATPRGRSSSSHEGEPDLGPAPYSSRGLLFCWTNWGWHHRLRFGWPIGGKERDVSRFFLTNEKTKKTTEKQTIKTYTDPFSRQVKL